MTSVKTLSEFMSALNIIHTKNNLELEVRFKKFNIYQFKILLNKMQSVQISQTVNIINKGYIKTIYYEKGVKTSQESYTTKTTLVTLPLLAPTSCLISLSTEVTDVKKQFIDDILVRIKTRFSSVIKLSHQWRLDLTMVTQTNTISGLQEIINLSFKDLKYDNIMNMFETIKTRQLNISFEVELEFIGDINLLRQDDVSAAITHVVTMIDADHVKNSALRNELQKVASLLRVEATSMKRMLPSVKSLTRDVHSALFPFTNYFVTDKADGVRALAYMFSNYACIISDTVTVFNSKTNCKNTLLDGELIYVGENMVFYAFDVIYNNGEDLTKHPFNARITHLDAAVDLAKSLGMPVKRKTYLQINDSIERDIKTVVGAKNPDYEVDGIIIVEPNSPYLDTLTYKWKPNDRNTIDFLARLSPVHKKVDGQYPYILFVGASIEMIKKFNLSLCEGYKEIFGDISGGYIPIQFSPSSTKHAYMFYYKDDTLDNKIIELRCINGCKAAMGCGDLVDWDLLKVRTDREGEMASGQYFGNDLRVAESIWENYIDPFPIEQLYSPPEMIYFNKEKSPIYNAQVSAISFMKTKRISSFQHAEWVVDLAAGKGQDLRRYLESDIGNLIAIDNDKAAIAELVRRRYEMAKTVTNSMGVSVIKTDLNTDYQIICEQIYKAGLPKTGADVVICNLAFHYFAQTVEGIQNMVNLCKKIVKPGGVVSMTVVIGKNIFNLLKDIPTGMTWDSYEGDILKYSIKKLYSEKTMLDAGQQIGVLLPFTKGEYYIEPLLNLDTVVREFALQGFELTDRTNATDYLEEFKMTNRSKTLTAEDIKYISLYGELCFCLE